jgi:hypothetical protein
VCEQHNIVNENLSKPKATCTLAWLDERWRDGRPECWSDQSAMESLGHGGDGEDEREAAVDATVELLGKLEEFDRN